MASSEIQGVLLQPRRSLLPAGLAATGTGIAGLASLFAIGLQPDATAAALLPAVSIMLLLTSPSARATHFKGDYTFLMTRLPGDDTLVRYNVGPKALRYGIWARELPAGKALRLALDPTFAASLAGAPVSITVIYLDSGGSTLMLEAGGETSFEQLKGNGGWKELELALPQGQLDADPQGAHIVLRASGERVVLHMVEVRR